ncbi:MAG: hypothetical protein WD055_01125 [Candidatus Dependentiae bacterium]
MKFIKPFVLPLLLLAVVFLFKTVYVQELSAEQKEQVVKSRFLTYDQLREQLQLSDESDEQGVESQSAQSQQMEKRIVSNEQLLSHMAAQLASRSVEQVASYVAHDGIPLDQRIELLHEIIINDAYGFSYDDAVQLVLDIANRYQPGSESQKQVFKLLTQYKDLLKKSSPLFIAVENGYKQTILPLIEWSMKMAPQHPEVKEDLQELKYRALVRAVDEENVKALHGIYNFSQGISKEHATDLVWHIAKNGKSASLLPELKKMGADIDQSRGRMTPVIQAVVNKYIDVVEQLIKLNVDLNKIADLETGSALQQAIASRDVPMENLLRRSGAHE